MIIAEEKRENKKIKKDVSRREHLKLAIEERRRQLSAQADQLISHYKKTEDERRDWQGGNIIDF